MEFGITMFPTDLSMRPDELAQEVELHGFSSLYFPEHSHIPVSRRTPWPGGAQLPEEYRRLYDPFVALTAAAMATTSLRIGAGVALVAERDPIHLAKSVSSLDVLSGGRFVLGVGYGWNREEMASHGTNFGTRRALVSERVQLMKRLWSQEIAEYEGDLASLSPSWQWPKPLQRPHPPVLLGAAPGPRTFDDVVTWADGWLPAEGRYDIVEHIEELRRHAEDQGRDPASISVTVFLSKGDPGMLERYRNAAVDEVVILLPSAGRDALLPELDRATLACSRFSAA